MTSIISKAGPVLLLLCGGWTLASAQDTPSPTPQPADRRDLTDISKYRSPDGIPPMPAVDIPAKLKAFNQTWTGAGKGPSESMPLGNGDIGLNVWTEPSGDFLFYIGKTDAWGESPNLSNGLMKLGRIRVNVTPNPLGAATGSTAPCTQILKLHEGEIELREGLPGKEVRLRLWVDANHPVIRLEANSDEPVTIKVSLEDWRKELDGHFSPDVILAAQKNNITWYHRDAENADAAVKNWTYGALIHGAEFQTQSDTVLISIKPSTTQKIVFYPLAMTAEKPGDWEAAVQQEAKKDDQVDWETAQTAHRAWWNQFWERSYVFLDEAMANGTAKAYAVNEGYILQRFTTACAGRGGAPIKFNGSVFVIDWQDQMQGKPPVLTHITADFRAWGGQYWFQNTRAMYWPRLMAGDFDEMQPLFTMYKGQLERNRVQVKAYYNHEGAYFAETNPYWGGALQNLTNNKGGSYTANYHTPILELSMMMLDYYDYTGDKAFVRETLLPIATAGLTFFDQHFPHEKGKLVLDPDNAIEMYWKVHNPAPDIGALHAVIPRLLKLPPDLLTATQAADFQRILNELPDLPTGMVEGKKVLLPYEGDQTAKGHNFENPELYAIYPFRLYGIGRGADNLDTVMNTWNQRKFKGAGCWVQDPIQSAMLGLSDYAQKYVTFDLTRRDPAQKFPAFWERGHDYMPDEDNGGNGENGLQEMLLQVIGDKLVLLPAWPKTWNAEFRLHGPRQTVVEGQVVAGKLTHLTVLPSEEKASVVIAPQ